MPAGGMPVARQVTAMMGTLRITDGMMVNGTITLPMGVTASGAFTPPSGEWLTSIAASGATLTLTSGGIGTTPTVTTIMLVRATAMGTATATPISGAIPGYFQSITTSGDTITFTDQGGATGTIRIVPGAGCP
jgi:hypothetical protein